MELKIILHALGSTMGGSVRHLMNFLPCLEKHDPDTDYILLARESFPEISNYENLRIVKFKDKDSSGWLRRLYLDNQLINRFAKEEKADAFITLTNFGPLKPPCPSVLFQRNSLYYCPAYLESISGKLKAETYLRTKLSANAMANADAVVTPSNAMASMIRARCPRIPKEKFRVLYHGFNPGSLKKEPLSQAHEKLFSDKRVKILYPTHPAKHKGFEVLFDMLFHLKKKRDDFVLFSTISYKDWPDGIVKFQRRIRKLGLGDNVVFTGRIPQGQMGWFYEKCDLMVYPSLCESFGFSMVEALGFGLPILAADTQVNREICDEGALYYPPEAPADGARVLGEFFRKERRKSISNLGRETFNSTDWSWDRYAINFLNILGSVI